MGRAPCCDKASVKKGPWSPEEDAKLKAYIEENGTGGNWIALPQKIGLKRCGKSCRLRWLNYLRPNIKHGDFTEEEEHIICSLYISIGSRWSIIAAQLPGRTDNDIKNYWNTKLKKKLLGKRAPSRRARANQDPCGLAGGGATGGAASCGGGRIQLHMRLQGLYSAFGCTASSNVVTPPQWPKLETLMPNRPLPAASAGVTSVEMTSSSMASGFAGYGIHDELYDFLYKCESGAQDSLIPSLPELQCPDGSAIIGADEKFSTWTSSCDYGSGGSGEYGLGYDQ
uniref:Uncharacterized protein n=1 Tax=Oryza brachyantha TaxID=4533 RepID=J3LHT2_ORYBR